MSDKSGTRWSDPRNWRPWLGVWILRLLSGLPRPLTRHLGFLMGAFAARINVKRREYVRINLEICFPELTEEERGAMLSRHFRIMGRTLLDLPQIWRGRAADLVTIEGEEHLIAARAAGRSVILLTGHGLALDVAGIALAQRYPLATMAHRAGDPVFDRFIHEARARAGRVYRRSEGLRPVLRSMREGYAFYYMPDEDLRQERHVFVPYFGVLKATLPAPGRLARLANAVVIPCYGYWLAEQDRYLFKLHPPLENFPSGDEMADATRMNAVLEQMVREHPEQYMWMLKFFQTRPGGALSPYRGGTVERQPFASVDGR